MMTSLHKVRPFLVVCVMVLHVTQFSVQASSFSPRVSLSISSQLPNTSRERANMTLLCTVGGVGFTRLLNIRVAERAGNEVKQLAALDFLLPRCVNYPETKKVEAKGELEVKTGFLKVQMTTGKEDVNVEDYVCSVGYLDDKLMPGTIKVKKGKEYLKLFRLINLLAHSKWKKQIVTLDKSMAHVKTLAYMEEGQASLVNDCYYIRKSYLPISKRHKITLSDGTQVLCDTETDGGGWTIFQRRIDGHVNFYRGWNDYVKGFGDLDTEFWLGLDNLRRLLTRGPHELRVDFTYKGKNYYAHYDQFNILDASTSYKLEVGGYSGNARDSLSNHNSMQFSTFDADHDTWSGGNCAQKYTGAWWYRACQHSNLNGKWGAGDCKGPCWYHTTGSNPATFTEMKIRLVK